MTTMCEVSVSSSINQTYSFANFKEKQNTKFFLYKQAEMQQQQ